MTSQHRSLHRQFLNFRERYRKFELEFIKLLQETERTRLHRALGCSSVFKYAVDILAFSESVAYMYISVARKALEFPRLTELTVSKASRIVSTLTVENADELILFAKQNSSRKIDREVARRNPKAGKEKFKFLADEFFCIEFKASSDFPEMLSRVQSLQAQRGLDAGIGAALEAGLKAYLRKHDPVEKAERAVARQKKKSASEFCANGVHKAPDRVPLTAAEKHAVFTRDRGRCTYINRAGIACGGDRWVDVHHLIHVSCGGGNEPENLTTLCSFHHDMIHQLELPGVG